MIHLSFFENAIGIFPADFITVLRRKGCHTRLLLWRRIAARSLAFGLSTLVHHSQWPEFSKQFPKIMMSFFFFILNYCNVIENDKIEVICSLKMVETITIWIEVLAD